MVQDIIKIKRVSSAMVQYNPDKDLYKFYKKLYED